MKNWLFLSFCMLASTTSFAAINNGEFDCQGMNKAESARLTLEQGTTQAQVEFLRAGVTVEFTCDAEVNPYSTGGETLFCRSSFSEASDMIVQTNQATKNDFYLYVTLIGSDYTKLTGSKGLVHRSVEIDRLSGGFIV